MRQKRANCLIDSSRRRFSRNFHSAMRISCSRCSYWNNSSNQMLCIKTMSKPFRSLGIISPSTTTMLKWLSLRAASLESTSKIFQGLCQENTYCFKASWKSSVKFTRMMISLNRILSSKADFSWLLSRAKKLLSRCLCPMLILSIIQMIQTQPMNTQKSQRRLE